ncbi:MULTISPECIES: cation:proton antiporter domain-containing protein [Butyricimonas]|uniref:cation:proton antiporter domain-containing protein n=1 Tax=Butyricimonas TaxID=574697 RepID=UPI0007FB3A68|nr:MULTISPECIES: cation:proton antiporter [Butyricimonas]
MKKVFLFSIFLLCGLFLSQILPSALGGAYGSFYSVCKWLMFICLAFIMINVGREFELDKTKWKSYTTDYFIAMATAAVPWLLIAFYYIFFLDTGLSWENNLLISRFAAPTSAGILFTMLAAAGLKREWIYKKTQVLAIFDDLDTILLMIPLQILMIGFKWQLFVIILVVCLLLIFGWKRLSSLNLPQSWKAIVLYSVCIVATFESVYLITKSLMGQDGAIHIEVLLPAFVLGMVMKTVHNHSREEERASSFISYLFMFLVGLSTPIFIGLDTAGENMPGWGILVFHVIVVTLLSNLGKMFPLFFYRDRKIQERLALSIGMFTRGEVGAGIIVIAMGYQLGGPALIISILSLVLNLVLTGFFVIAVKRISQSVYGVKE